MAAKAAIFFRGLSSGKLTDTAKERESATKHSQLVHHPAPSLDPGLGPALPPAAQRHTLLGVSGKMEADKLVKQLAKRDVAGRITVLANIAQMDASERPGPSPELAEILLETMCQVKQLSPSYFMTSAKNCRVAVNFWCK